MDFLEIKKPIFIIGVPRSGTTVLDGILGQHPEIGWFSRRTLEKILSKEFLKFVYLRRRIFEMRKYDYPIDDFGPRFFTTVQPPVEAGYLWDEIFSGSWNVRITDDKVPFLKKIIIKTLVEDKKTRFLAKYPKLSIHISLIMKIFPDAKFIHIIRDGRAVVNSMIERSKENKYGYFGIPLGGLNQIHMISNDKIKKHALQWKLVIEKIKSDSKNLNPKQFLELKFEDFVVTPEQHLKKITEFCELEQFDYVYKKDGTIVNSEGKKAYGWEMMTIKELSDPNKKYTNNLNIAEIEKHIGSTLKDLGYN